MKTYFPFFLLLYAFSLRLVAQTDQPHIIFIIVDDLNNYCSEFTKHPQIETPWLNLIAQNSTRFTNASCPSPKCAPSRTSFMTGKDCAYSEVYNNPNCKPFRDYFNGKQVFTLPQYLKDSAGYFTIGINKIYHCFESDPDYDSITLDACEKEFSWNHYIKFYNGDAPEVVDYGNTHNEGLSGAQWSKIPDSLEQKQYDFIAIDSAIQFLQMYADGIDFSCGKPLFINIGLRKPHSPWYIPESYYLSYYAENFFSDDFIIPYNTSTDSIYNGVVLPLQPTPRWADFEALPSNGIAQYAALYMGTENKIEDEVDHYPYLPHIHDTLSDMERKEILKESFRANALMAYLAAAKFVDSQIGRLYNEIIANPKFANNTILIIAGDNGFAHGQKKHWEKGGLWDTDIQVPLMIADLRNVKSQTCTKSVSLLDLFPTICDMIQIPFPTFSDSSQYFDGHSMNPFIQNPELKVEKPTLVSYQLHGEEGEDCYPIYAVRNNEFHYIYYKSNTTSFCEEINDFIETELYEVGELKNRDSHEWNNLIADPFYHGVEQYLSQWLPDSSLYLKKTYSLDIIQNRCIYQKEDSVYLNIEFYDDEGNYLEQIPEGKHLIWTTNLSTDISTLETFSFDLDSFPSIFSGEIKEISILCMLYNEDFSLIEGLKIVHLVIETEPKLFPSFSIKCLNKTATIFDVNYPEGTISAKWNYGDGNFFDGFSPAEHVYESYGNYTVKCDIVNNECSVSQELNIQVDGGIHIYSTFDYFDTIFVKPKFSFSVSPNPTSNYLFIEFINKPSQYLLEISDMQGKKIFQTKLITESGRLEFNLNVLSLSRGNYIIKLYNEEESFVQLFCKQ